MGTATHEFIHQHFALKSKIFLCNFQLLEILFKEPPTSKNFQEDKVQANY